MDRDIRSFLWSAGVWSHRRKLEKTFGITSLECLRKISASELEKIGLGDKLQKKLKDALFNLENSETAEPEDYDSPVSDIKEYCDTSDKNYSKMPAVNSSAQVEDGVPSTSAINNEIRSCAPPTSVDNSGRHSSAEGSRDTETPPQSVLDKRFQSNVAVVPSTSFGKNDEDGILSCSASAPSGGVVDKDPSRVAAAPSSCAGNAGNNGTRSSATATVSSNVNGTLSCATPAPTGAVGGDKGRSRIAAVSAHADNAGNSGIRSSAMVAAPGSERGGRPCVGAQRAKSPSPCSDRVLGSPSHIAAVSAHAGNAGNNGIRSSAMVAAPGSERCGRPCVGARRDRSPSPCSDRVLGSPSHRPDASSSESSSSNDIDQPDEESDEDSLGWLLDSASDDPALQEETVLDGRGSNGMCLQTFLNSQSKAGAGLGSPGSSQTGPDSVFMGSLSEADSVAFSGGDTEDSVESRFALDPAFFSPWNLGLDTLEEDVNEADGSVIATQVPDQSADFLQDDDLGDDDEGFDVDLYMRISARMEGRSRVSPSKTQTSEKRSSLKSWPGRETRTRLSKLPQVSLSGTSRTSKTKHLANAITGKNGKPPPLHGKRMPSAIDPSPVEHDKRKLRKKSRSRVRTPTRSNPNSNDKASRLVLRPRNGDPKKMKTSLKSRSPSRKLRKRRSRSRKHKEEKDRKRRDMETKEPKYTCVKCPALSEPSLVLDQDGILIVYKPAYWTVTTSLSASAVANRKYAIQNWIRQNAGQNHAFVLNDFRAGLVHRLDVQTSGPLLVGSTESSFKYLRESLQKHQWYKEYLALMHGRLPADRSCGVLTYRLATGQDSRGPGWITSVDENGEYAETRYEAVAAFDRKCSENGWNRFTMVRMQLVTGKTHQIRVHLQELGRELGFPVSGLVGDYKYLSKEQMWDDRKICNRVFLHEQRLHFPRPGSRRMVRVFCPIPKDLRKAIGHLNLDESLTEEYRVRRESESLLPPVQSFQKKKTN